MNLEDVMLREIRQSQNSKFYIIHLYEVPGIGQFIDTNSRTMVAGGQKERAMNGYCLVVMKFQFGKINNILETEGYDGCATM